MYKIPGLELSNVKNKQGLFARNKDAKKENKQKKKYGYFEPFPSLKFMRYLLDSKRFFFSKYQRKNKKYQFSLYSLLNPHESCRCMKNKWFKLT